MSLSSHYLSSVRAFHYAVGVEPLARLTHREQLVMVALRATLIDEEAKEYWESVERLSANRSTETLQHAAKEAADLLYVIVGTADVFGVTSGVQDTSRHLPYPSGGFLRDQVLRAQIRILIDEITDLGRMIHHHDDFADALDDVIGDIHHVVRSLTYSAAQHGIPLRQAYDAVHTSNMSKIDPETGQPFSRREDGKVLKGPGYRDADLSWLIAA